MFKNTIDFQIGQLTSLEDQLFEITIEENGQLNFYIEGKNDNSVYSINFTSIISIEEMLQFNLNERINFIQYVDEGDIVFGKNGLYDLNTEIKIDITRYLPTGFLLVIYFKDRDNLVGYLELNFLLKIVDSFATRTG